MQEKRQRNQMQQVWMEKKVIGREGAERFRRRGRKIKSKKWERAN